MPATNCICPANPRSRRQPCRRVAHALPRGRQKRAHDLTINSDMRLDILLPINGNSNFQAARQHIQKTLPPKAKADVTPHPQGTSTNTATVAIDELTKGLRHLSVTNTKTTPTVATHWTYQLNKLMWLCHVTQPTQLTPVWHALAKEKRGTPARICIQVACDAMATKLDLESLVITHHIANIV